MKFEKGFDLKTLNKSTLVIPSISVANIPQLAIDLLLHSLDFTKVATLSDHYLYPFASPVDHSACKPRTQGVSLALEVYFSKNRNITIIQQRSPILQGFATAHIDEVILPFIREAGFAHTMLLHSMDAGLEESYIPGTITHITNEDLISRAVDTLRLSESQGVSSRWEDPYMRRLVEMLPAATPLSVLVTYAYEGDNFYDARVLAGRVSEVLLVDVESWESPVSWFGVYGDKPVATAMEDGLYG